MSEQKPPLIADATRDLARFGADLHFEQIPADVVARIKTSVLDSLGCCLFGATLPWTRKVADLAKAIHPKILYPYHFGNTNTAALADLLKDEKGIEVRIRELK